MPVFDAAKAAVEADSNKRSGGEGAEEFVGEGDYFGAFVAAGHEFIMMDDAVLFVGSSAFAGASGDSHGGFDGALPMGFFTPAGEADLSGEAAGEVDDFTRGVPGEIQVGGEVDVGFKNVAIDFDLVRFLVFF